MSPLGPFDIAPEQIIRLGSSLFAEFINRLLDLEARANDIPGRNLDLTYNVNTPDGGVDAALKTDVQSSWVPVGSTVWQFKATNPSPADCKKAAMIASLLVPARAWASAGQSGNSNSSATAGQVGWIIEGAGSQDALAAITRLDPGLARMYFDNNRTVILAGDARRSQPPSNEVPLGWFDSAAQHYTAYGSCTANPVAHRSPAMSTAVRSALHRSRWSCSMTRTGARPPMWKRPTSAPT